MRASLRTLASLAGEQNPLEDLGPSIAILRRSTAECRNLEWKSCGLFGPKILQSTKYRAVKAAISFANTDGGFLVFGVDAQGAWAGLSSDDFREFDPAKVTDLINGIVFPDLPFINYATYIEGTASFVILHVPPSGAVPHATTREISSIELSGGRRTVIAKHAVYYRQGAKSDTATPHQLQKLVERRTMHVRDELVRRVREVPVPVFGTLRAASLGVGTAVTVARITSDPSAPVVRLSRGAGQGSGVLMHEELSDGLFEEINNVLDANGLLARTRDRFVLGEPIYYRVYAERHHVLPSSGHPPLLLRTAMELYAPFLFWLTVCDAPTVAATIHRALEAPKHPMILGAFRAVVLLGEDAKSWLKDRLDRRYQHLTQPPEYYWTYHRMVNRPQPDARLAAMRVSPSTAVELADGRSISAKHLLASPEEASGHLSRICLAAFGGETKNRPTARLIDVAAYGTEVEKRAPQLWDALRALDADTNRR
jgi:hypothetical protein